MQLIIITVLSICAYTIVHAFTGEAVISVLSAIVCVLSIKDI